MIFRLFGWCKRRSELAFVWLEESSNAGGLEHIYVRHEVDFASKGISRAEIPTVVMNALERGEIIGTSGSAHVYRITQNGVEKNIGLKGGFIFLYTFMGSD